MSAVRPEEPRRASPAAENGPRIALVITSFHPIVGGGETHALLLSREWRRQGAEVFVLTRRTTPALARREDVHGVPVVRVAPARFRRWGKYLMLAPAFLQLVRRRRDYDLILVSGLRILGVAGMLAAKMLGKPCVLRAASCGELSGGFIWDSPHGDRVRLPLARAAIRGLLALRNRLLLRADGFLAISGAIAEEYRACGVPEDKIRVINNGTDTDRFRPAEAEERAALRRKLGLPPGGRLFAYAGKLNRGKGLEFLLRAWRRHASAHPDAHLVLIGSGGLQFLSCEAALRAFVAAEGLAGRVTFTGYVANVDEYLRSADVFVFPSENESLSNALIEAAACGLPCLASNVGGIPDTIGDRENGRLLPPGDEEAWVRALAETEADPESAAEWGRRGRERVVARNGMAEVAAAHLRWLAPMVRGPRG